MKEKVNTDMSEVIHSDEINHKSDNFTIEWDSETIFIDMFN